MKSALAQQQTQQPARRRRQRLLSSLVGLTLLSESIPGAIAQSTPGTPAGTEINNSAYGSFDNPSAPSGTPSTTIESNEVVLTVAEVAGIAIIPQGAVEAPAGVAGNTPGANDGFGQGDGIISAEDIIYFTYRIINIGNDQTQFFVPAQPANVVNGGATLSESFDPKLYGPIEIVAYNDGLGTPSSNTTVSIPVTGSGTSTDGLSGLPNDGSVPAGGYLEVRVPIKADSTLVSGDQIIPTLGSTPSEASQNVPYTVGGEFSTASSDVFTLDNVGTDNGDANGAPADPEREASARNPVTIAAIELDYGSAPDAGLGTAQNDYETEPGRGPSHLVDDVTFLGSGVDKEPVLDDPAPEDDGVSIDGTLLHDQNLVIGRTYDFDIKTAGPGVLSAWVDFNSDGSFDVSEQVALNQSPSSNQITLSIPIPTSAAIGETYARFRYSTEPDLSPTGRTNDGEVEDYRIVITDDAPRLRLVKRVTSVGGIDRTNEVDDPDPLVPDDNPSVNWPDNYLVGEIDDAAEPGEAVDYTLYFLSDGSVSIRQVEICDLIPDNTTYVPGSLRISRGTGTETTLSDAADGDAGQFFDNTVDPLVAPCIGTNTDGGISVRVPGILPPTTSAGNPPDSYGYIRFSVTVDLLP